MFIIIIIGPWTNKPSWRSYFSDTNISCLWPFSWMSGSYTILCHQLILGTGNVILGARWCISGSGWGRGLHGFFLENFLKRGKIDRKRHSRPHKCMRTTTYSQCYGIIPWIWAAGMCKCICSLQSLKGLRQPWTGGGREDSLLIIPVLWHLTLVQAQYNPHRIEGCGLTDGEVMERLWSYLRRMAKTTKEMRPSHRIDALTCALLHYGDKSRQKLGMV